MWFKKSSRSTMEYNSFETYFLNITTTNNKMSVVIEITPKVGGARAENCFLTNGSRKKYDLTNEMGCPIDRRLFPGWNWNINSSKLTATGAAFSLKNGLAYLYCNVDSCFDSKCVVSVKSTNYV